MTITDIALLYENRLLKLINAKADNAGRKNREMGTVAGFTEGYFTLVADFLFCKPAAAKGTKIKNHNYFLKLYSEKSKVAK